MYQKSDGVNAQGLQKPGRLADVLFGKSRNQIPEQVWAKLVQSVAAGDEQALYAL
jgi:hypothetical protein